VPAKDGKFQSQTPDIFNRRKIAKKCRADDKDLVMENIELKVMCSFSLRVFVCAASVTAKQL
jgi:hypothetical protein